MEFCPSLSLRDISPKGGGAETKTLSNFVPPPLKGEGDRGGVSRHHEKETL